MGEVIVDPKHEVPVDVVKAIRATLMVVFLNRALTFMLILFNRILGTSIVIVSSVNRS
jgi:hypothetical protein